MKFVFCYFLRCLFGRNLRGNDRISRKTFFGPDNVHLICLTRLDSRRVRINRTEHLFRRSALAGTEKKVFFSVSGFSVSIKSLTISHPIDGPTDQVCGGNGRFFALWASFLASVTSSNRHPFVVVA